MRSGAIVAALSLLACASPAAGALRRSVRVLGADPGRRDLSAVREAFGTDQEAQEGNALEEIAAGRRRPPQWLVEAAAERPTEPGAAPAAGADSFLQVGAGAGAGAGGGEQGQCEMCMFALHESQFGRLPPCGASSKPTYSSWMCVQVVRSMLRFARDIMDTLNNGCYHYDKLAGWKTEKPCSAHAVCGRLLNVYSLQHETMCPPDLSYAFKHKVADPSPKVYNPLLPYAIKWYRDLNASSVAQSPGAGYPV